MVENLYCPRCAKATSRDTSYCRNCGLPLDDVANIVKGDAANAPVVPARRGFTVFGLGLGIFMLGLVVAILNAALRDFDLFPDRYGKMAFLILIAVGLLTLSYPMIVQFRSLGDRKHLDNRKKAMQSLEAPPAAGQLSPADTNQIVFPAPIHDPAMAGRLSVTENTTRQLRRDER